MSFTFFRNPFEKCNRVRDSKPKNTGIVKNYSIPFQNNNILGDIHGYPFQCNILSGTRVMIGAVGEVDEAAGRVTEVFARKAFSGVPLVYILNI